jgi:hypothetical protein
LSCSRRDASFTISYAAAEPILRGGRWRGGSFPGTSGLVFAFRPASRTRCPQPPDGHVCLFRREFGGRNREGRLKFRPDPFARVLDWSNVHRENAFRCDACYPAGTATIADDDGARPAAVTLFVPWRRAMG